MVLAVFSATAKDKGLLGTLGVTHVLNAADGPQHIDTGAVYYDDTDIVYYGVEAADHKTFDLSPFFHPAAEFIQYALAQKGNPWARGSHIYNANVVKHRRWEKTVESLVKFHSSKALSCLRYVADL